MRCISFKKSPNHDLSPLRITLPFPEPPFYVVTTLQSSAAAVVAAVAASAVVV